MGVGSEEGTVSFGHLRFTCSTRQHNQTPGRVGKGNHDIAEDYSQQGYTKTPLGCALDREEHHDIAGEDSQPGYRKMPVDCLLHRQDHHDIAGGVLPNKDQQRRSSTVCLIGKNTIILQRRTS